MDYDTRLEETRVWFLKVAADVLGPQFEEVSGELWLRSRSAVVSILSTPPEMHLITARRQLRKLLKLIRTQERDFLNRGTVTERSARVYTGLEETE